MAKQIPMMVVAAKAKAYLRDTHGVRIGADALGALNLVVQKACDQAARAALDDKRQTIKERDFTL